MESPNARDLAEEQENNKIYKRALDKWGFRLQRLVAIEEMSELTKELIKYERGPSSETEINIAEETADLEIMIEQLKFGFQNHEAVAAWKIKKLSRLKNYLDKTDTKGFTV